MTPTIPPKGQMAPKETLLVMPASLISHHSPMSAAEEQLHQSHQKVCRHRQHQIKPPIPATPAEEHLFSTTSLSVTLQSQIAMGGELLLSLHQTEEHQNDSSMLLSSLTTTPPSHHQSSSLSSSFVPNTKLLFCVFGRAAQDPETEVAQLSGGACQHGNNIIVVLLRALSSLLLRTEPNMRIGRSSVIALPHRRTELSCPCLPFLRQARHH